MTSKKSAKKSVAKKAPAKKKAVAKKAPAKKAAPKKAAAKKAPAKKAPAKKVPAKKAPAKKAPAKKAPAKKAAPKKAAVKKAPAKKAAPKKAPAKQAPAKKAETKTSTPAKQVTTEKKTPVKTAPAKKTTGQKADRVIKTTSAKKAAVAKKAPAKKAAPVTPVKAAVRRKKDTSAPKNAGVKPAHLKDKKWLSGRNDQLQSEKAILAEQVEEFRAQLDLLLETAEAGDDTSSDESSEGTSINVQISELVAERKGRLEHIEMIDGAIARIADGSYGFCWVDNVAIPKARLEARPESERCVDHKTSMFDNSRR